MPGVSISTAVRTGPVNAGLAPASTFFIVGETARGIDTEAVAVTSLSEYTTAFGGYEANKYTYQQIRTFFEEGGSLAYIARVTAAEGVAASKALLVGVSDPGITLTAVGKGEWGNGAAGGLYVAVANESTYFNVTIYFGDDTADYIIYQGTGFNSLTDAIESINSSTVLANYCTATLTETADPTDLLKDQAATAFTSGDDDTVAESDFLDALDFFSQELGAGAVAIPGLADATDDEDIYDAILAHCVANNRIGLLSFAAGTDNGTAAGASTTYGDINNTNHEYLAFFHPWVKIPSGTGATLTVPPEGYAAAARSRAHNRVGTWQPFAGAGSQARFITGIETVVNRTDGDALDAARVNAIRVIEGTVRIYGARSHSKNTTQWRFITHRDTMNFIVDRANIALEPLVFSVINGRRSVYADIASALKGVMEPIRIAGGLYEGFNANGVQTDYGYSIKVDDSINPLTQLESGEIKAELGVRVSSVGDKITVTITKSNLTATLV